MRWRWHQRRLTRASRTGAKTWPWRRALRIAAASVVLGRVRSVVAEEVNVTGSLQATFPSNLVSCAEVTELALLESIAVAVSTVTDFAYGPEDVASVTVDVCSARRLADGDARRLAEVASAVTYVLSVASASLAVFVVSAVATAPSTFAGAFVSQMAASGITVSDVSVAEVSSSASLALFSSIDRSVVGTYAADSAGAVAAPLWRLVGRSVPTEWTVSLVRWYEDAACSHSIPVVPRRDELDLRRYNGRAFDGPWKRRRDGFSASDVFEDNGIDWSSMVPCDDTSDRCHVGFDWLSDQADLGLSASASTYRATGVLRRTAVEPRCVLLVQSEEAGRFAPTVAVQYKAAGSRTWQSLLVRAGLVGGAVQLRLPVSR